MSLIIRIDVDRPYGRKTLARQLLSRISSDFYFPKIHFFNYLADLEIILKILNQKSLSSYIFFRKCSFPSQTAIELINEGKHTVGLHLENSRTFETFVEELTCLENHLDCKVNVFSKHGSGIYKYGFHHYALYELEKYIEWGKKAGLKMFFGNNENPEQPKFVDEKLLVFPSAFWLEPFWRDVHRFTPDWLINEAQTRDVVLLFHPDNILVDGMLLNDLNYILDNVTVAQVR